MTSSRLHETNEEAIDRIVMDRIVADLERYAGWLGHGTTAGRVRTDVQALRSVIDSGNYQELRDSVQALLLDVSELANSATKELIQERSRLLRKITTREDGEAAVGVDGRPLPVR